MLKCNSSDYSSVGTNKHRLPDKQQWKQDVPLAERWSQTTVVVLGLVWFPYLNETANASVDGDCPGSSFRTAHSRRSSFHCASSCWRRAEPTFQRLDSVPLVNKRTFGKTKRFSFSDCVQLLTPSIAASALINHQYSAGSSRPWPGGINLKMLFKQTHYQATTSQVLQMGKEPIKRNIMIYSGKHTGSYLSVMNH